MDLLARLRAAGDSVTALARAGLLKPMRPDRTVRMMAAARSEGLSIATGFATAAQRCPDRPGLIDELGTLTWQELDERSHALAAALQALPGAAPVSDVAGPAAPVSDVAGPAAPVSDVAGPAAPATVGIMCRNHRGFVQALVAATRIGANVLLLNTSFAGPALAEVVNRENVDTVIYDEEFAASVDRALAGRPDTRRILGWTDQDTDAPTVEGLIAAHTGGRATATGGTSRLILLTSGTTGTPKGARHSGGGAGNLVSILRRTPWRVGETTVIVAPMFHAWGFSQLMFASAMACTVVTRRKFDPEATLELVDRYHATGLCVVPVMFDRIMDLPDEIRHRYSGRSLRFAACSGSRMRPDVVTKFMDEFGDVIYNNYNATEAGMIATATPADLRAAPDTAGTPAVGTEIRIFDERFNEVPTGEVGRIFVKNSTQFDGYTSGNTKDFHNGFMSSGDLGRVDAAGRLFVVGRDDEMIVSGGENVYPIEVEKTLTAHPDVAEAAVLGVDDEQYGQRLVAFVVLADGAAATPDDLKAHVRDNLANYKVPRTFSILPELPRGNTGKILRNELAARITTDG